MGDIVVTRIDNRLIHGQITSRWCGELGINLIIVANDEVAENFLRQKLLDMASPSFVEVSYWSIEKTISEIQSVTMEKKILLVCETPQDVLKLVKGGAPIKNISVGNMHMAEGKRRIMDSIAVDDNDISVFEELCKADIDIEIRRVPMEPAESINRLFELNSKINKGI